MSILSPLLLKAVEEQCSCATHCPVAYHLLSLLSFTKYRTLLCLSGFLFKDYSDIQRGLWIVVNRCHRIDISLNFIIHFSNLSTNLSVTFNVQFSVQIRSMSMLRVSQQIKAQLPLWKPTQCILIELLFVSGGFSAGSECHMHLQIYSQDALWWLTKHAGNILLLMSHVLVWF